MTFKIKQIASYRLIWLFTIHPRNNTAVISLILKRRKGTYNLKNQYQIIQFLKGILLNKIMNDKDNFNIQN